MAEEWNFIGPLKKSQALFLDKPGIVDELKQFRPERCAGCWEHLEVVVIGGLATQIVMKELTTVEAAREVVAYTADCTGSEIDTTRSDAPAICPKKVQEKQNGRTVCW